MSVIKNDFLNINKRILTLEANVSASSLHHSQGKVSKCCEDLIEWSHLDRDLIARYIYLVEKHEIGLTSLVTKITETAILANSR